MDNPLELPIPNDPIERIHAFARDLAYGAIHELWSPTFTVMFSTENDMWRSNIKRGESGEIPPDHFGQYIAQKWQRKPPSPNFLVSFDYLFTQNHGNGQSQYLLTSKAFALLDKPLTPPSTFISYRQDQSSALGLLIEARLKIADSNAHIFIDKLLVPGDDWEKRLQDTIHQSRYFVCLLGAETLARSKMVYQEIQWAADAGCTMIAVCHGGYTIDALCPPELSRKQAIIIRQESAEEYELAMIKLLDSLGYSTY